MPLANLFILLAQALLLVLSAFCSASETALFGLTYNDRLQLKKSSPRAAAAVEKLLDEPRALLVTLLMANMTVNVVFLALGSVLVLGFENAALGATINAVTVVLLVALGEVSPKLIAASQRVRLCTLLAPAVMVLFRVIRPVRGFVEMGVIAPLTRLLSPREPSSSSVTVDELSALVELGASQGAIARDEQQLLAQVVEFGATRVRDVMAPRMQIHWLGATSTHRDVIDLVKRTGVTHIPVYRGSPDQEVLGMLDARIYLGVSATGKPPRVVDSLQPISYIPETARLDQILEQTRRRQSDVLLCVDEHGAVDGLLRVSDIADRLVAKFSEEDVFAAEFDDLSDQGVTHLGAGVWGVPGRLGVRAWSELFGQEVDQRVATVAGLVMSKLGRIPRVGDRLEFGNVKLRVASMRGNIVERLEVSLTDASDDTELIPAEDAP